MTVPKPILLEPPTYGTLFSGIEGFGLGFDRAGMQSVFQCEIDKTCREILARHYPDVPRHDDVTTFNPAKFECLDVLAFGSPCQDLSVAGKRGGLAGARSGLFYEGIRIADAFRRRGLRFVVWENVPGALSSHDGRDIHAVLSAFLELGALDVAFRCVDSQYYTLAQRRLRLFVVADLRGECAGQILSLAEGLSGHPAPSRETGQRTAACLTRGAESSGRGGYAGRRREDDVNIVPEVAPPLRSEGPGTARVGDSRGQDCLITTQVSHPLMAKGNSSHDPTLETYVAHTLSAEGFDASEDGTGRGTPIIPIQEVGKRTGGGGSGQNGCGIGEPGDSMFTLQATAQHAIAFDPVGFLPTGGGSKGMAISDDLSPCVDASHSGQPAVKTGMRVRRLTPGECERLQGFPPGWTRYRADGSEIADGPRYKCLGNAVSVPVAEWIGKGIALALSQPR